MPSPLLSPQALRRCGSFLLLSSITVLGHAEVLAVSDQAHPLTNTGEARIVLLDAADRIEEQMSAGLPADPRQAAAMMSQRLGRGAAPDQQRALKSAYENLAQAWSLGVTKVPAVIVEGRYVVYGQSDVAQAQREIQRYRSNHQ